MSATRRDAELLHSAMHERVVLRLGADTTEALDLSASPIACAVADAWASMLGKLGVSTQLYRALDALELATRESPLRKVRP